MRGQHRHTIDALIPIAYKLAEEKQTITSDDIKAYLVKNGMDVPKPTVIGAVFQSPLFRKVGVIRGKKNGYRLNVYTISNGEPEPKPKLEPVITWCCIYPFKYKLGNVAGGYRL